MTQRDPHKHPNQSNPVPFWLANAILATLCGAAIVGAAIDIEQHSHKSLLTIPAHTVSEGQPAPPLPR